MLVAKKKGIPTASSNDEIFLHKKCYVVRVILR